MKLQVLEWTCSERRLIEEALDHKLCNAAELGWRKHQVDAINLMQDETQTRVLRSLSKCSKTNLEIVSLNRNPWASKRMLVALSNLKLLKKVFY